MYLIVRIGGRLKAGSYDVESGVLRNMDENATMVEDISWKWTQLYTDVKPHMGCLSVTFRKPVVYV